MDTKITGGDLALGANGLLERIYGLEEMLQQAWLCLSVPKGAFVYDRDFGSRIRGESPPAQLQALAEEALLGRCGAEITGCRVEGQEVVFTVSAEAGTGEVRVNLSPAPQTKEEVRENL